MTTLLLLSWCLTAVAQSPSAAASMDPQLIRVHVQTDDGGVLEELAGRRASVKHLAEEIAKQKKGKVMVSLATDELADVVVEVVDRGLHVPKVVIGLGAGMGNQPGRPAPPAPLTRHAQLRVRAKLAHDGDWVQLTNKNRAIDAESGWKSAAEDIAKQLEKWVAGHRAAILAARKDAAGTGR
jgi:hypothetical protein